MNKYVFSEGSMQTKINNKVVDNKAFTFEYDGNIGKGIIKDNSDSYYVELDNDDFRKILKKNPDQTPIKLENKLKTLLSNSKK